MLCKVSELVGRPLDYAVALCEKRKEPQLMGDFKTQWYMWKNSHYSTYWEFAGPIIDRENISIIRLEDENIPNKKGFWQNKYKTTWGAVIGIMHCVEDERDSYGDKFGEAYMVDAQTVVKGDTPIIAAMRCFVASKCGETIEIPDELLS